MINTKLYTDWLFSEETKFSSEFDRKLVYEMFMKGHHDGTFKKWLNTQEALTLNKNKNLHSDYVKAVWTYVTAEDFDKLYLELYKKTRPFYIIDRWQTRDVAYNYNPEHADFLFNHLEVKLEHVKPYCYISTKDGENAKRFVVWENSKPEFGDVIFFINGQPKFMPYYMIDYFFKREPIKEFQPYIEYLKLNNKINE